MPEGLDCSALAHLEEGFSYLSSELPTVLLNTLWKYTKATVNVTAFLSCTPLWRSSQYREILKLEEFRDWEKGGIKHISQIYQGCTLKTFIEIQQDYSIPTRTYFINTCN